MNKKLTTMKLWASTLYKLKQEALLAGIPMTRLVDMLIDRWKQERVIEEKCNENVTDNKS